MIDGSSYKLRGKPKGDKCMERSCIVIVNPVAGGYRPELGDTIAVVPVGTANVLGSTTPKKISPERKPPGRGKDQLDAMADVPAATAEYQSRRTTVPRRMTLAMERPRRQE